MAALDAPETTILLVDDHEANLEVTAALLEGPGRRLLKARSGAEALRLLVEHGVALVLLDVKMPTMDGYETARAIRALAEHAETPIVFITSAVPSEQEVLRGYTAGAVDFVVRPLNPDILTAKVAVFTDIAQKRAALAGQERAAREKADKLEALLREAADGIVTIDANGTVESMNPAAERIFGYEAAEVLGRNVKLLMPSPYREEHDAYLARYLRTGEKKIIGVGREVAGLRKDGTVFPLELAVTEIAGARRSFMGMVRDITSRKAAEAALRERDARLLEARADIDNFFSLTLALLCVADFEGRFRRLNPAWTAVLGWSLEEMVDQPFLDFVHPDDRERTAAAAARVAEYDNVLSFGNRYRCKDGSYRDFSWNACPSPGRRLIYAVAHDVTEMKRAEEALWHEKRASEAANVAKSAFLANMSHELRTPLNAVIGFSQLLLDGVPEPVTAEQEKFVSDILLSGQQLLTLINDILDLSRIDAGKVSISLEAVPTERALAEALSLVRVAAKERRVSLESVDRSKRAARADVGRLRQVLLNLLSNAVKFTPEGGAVEVGAEDRGDDIRFWVRDTGIGIEAEHLDKLFTAFFQAENPLTKRHKGTGLGLAISKQLVELQGGTIHVETAPTKGSTFWFTLPVASGEKSG